MKRKLLSLLLITCCLAVVSACSLPFGGESSSSQDTTTESSSAVSLEEASSITSVEEVKDVEFEKVAEDTARIRSWGYDLIKHDFTTFDNFGYPPHEDGDWHFYDRTVTNAQMILKLYKTIQKAAGGANDRRGRSQTSGRTMGGKQQPKKKKR